MHDVQWAEQPLLAALSRFDAGDLAGAKAVLFDSRNDAAVATLGQVLYDLWTEAGVFVTHSDLRKDGRDVGYASTAEIREAIARVVNKKPLG